MRFLLLFVLCLVATSAHADCTPANNLVGTKSRVDWVQGGLVYDTTTDQLKTCDGTNWNVVGSGGGLSGGTSGYLGVWTGATTMGLSSTTAGNNLFWDATNHRLGIGATSPGRKLDVVDASRASSFEVGSFGTGASATQQIRMGYDTANPAYGWIQASNFGTASQNLVLQPVAGNVGIGTTSPSYKLDVQQLGGTTFSGARVYSTGSALAYLDIQSDNTTDSSGAILRLISRNVDDSTATPVDLVKYNNGSFYVNNNETNAAAFTAFGVGASERMRITSSGNVGIGTTIPANPLTVASGAAQFPLALGILPSTHATSRRAALAIDNWLLLQDANGNGTKNLSVYQASPGAHRMVFSPDGSIAMAYNGGNVGIGTAIPNLTGFSGTTLSVVSSAASGGNVELGTSASDAAGQIAGSLSFNATSNTGAADNRVAMIRAITEGATAANRGGYLQFITKPDGGAQAEHMRINSAGNVGIGTSSPAQKLDVIGTVKANAITLNGAATTAILHATAGTGTTTIQGTNTGTSYGIYCNASNCGGASAWQNVSDLRLKERIETLGPAQGLDTVLRLRPVSFYWKDHNRDDIEGRKIGLIAQEVESLVPEVVHTGDDAAKTKSIAYSDLVPVLIRAIQDLKADNDNLRAGLKAANDNQAARDAAIEDLRREIEALKAAR